VEGEKHMVRLSRSVLHRIVGGPRAYFSVRNCSNPKKRLDRHADMAHHSRPMVSELMCGERLMTTSMSTHTQGYALAHDAIGEYAPIRADRIFGTCVGIP
jgi:hypothetical protein